MSEPRKKSYLIEVNPIPWKRPQLNGTRFYDGQARDKVSFSLYLLKQHDGEDLFSKPIHMDVVFYMPIPVNTKAKVKPTLNWHQIKPDLDNLCKFLWDSMNGVIISDDKILVSLSAKKMYSNKPRYEFTITEV